MEIKLNEFDNGKAFDFGKTSADYAKYRDIYPEEFYNKLLELKIGTEGQKILDLGTGTGVLPRNMYRYGAKWIGKPVTDCSGLLRRALYWLGESIAHHARYQYTDYCRKKGRLVNGRREDGTLPLPGSAVFLKGKKPNIHHVGVYVGDDTVVEAKGTSSGVVTSRLSRWDYWGELKMVDYTDAEKLEPSLSSRPDGGGI